MIGILNGESGVYDEDYRVWCLDAHTRASCGLEPIDLSMSSRAPIGLPSVRHGGPSGLNFTLEGKVTGKF